MTSNLNPTIFVQIASYRDPELLPTIRDCIAKARFPGRLSFGICWQHDEYETLAEFGPNRSVRVIDVPWVQSKGLCWARSLIQKLWQGEEYTLQLDSHHRFRQDWDVLLIDMLRSTGSAKPLVGSYAAAYDPKTNQKLGEDPWMMVADRFTESGTILFMPWVIPGWRSLTKPIPARFVSGHFYFTLGQHCQEYLYDPSLYFAGDELSLSIRSFTLGYDLFHPHYNLIWHEYTREGRVKHWTDHTNELKDTGATEMAWWERDLVSKQRLRQLVQEEDTRTNLGQYGLGTTRTHSEYEIYAGIDFKNRILSKYATEGRIPGQQSVANKRNS